MSDHDTFERILAALHDAMLNDTLWPTTSALIDEACNTVGNALLVSEGPPDDVRVTFAGLYYRGERRDDWAREYLKRYHPIDERIPRVRQLPDSRLAHITELYTAAELRTSPAYNEAMQRLSGQDSLNVRLAGPDGCNIFWIIGDPAGRSGWEAAQTALIERLLPHIRQFVRVRQALVKAEVLGTSLSALLDNTRVGIIYLDQRGQIVEANDRARAILRQGDGLVDLDGVPAARVPADRAPLERLVAAALPTSSTPAVSGSMRLRREPMLPPFVVHVKPVSVRQPDFGARQVAALVLITESEQVARINPAVVAATLGLTRIESQIVALLAEGRTVRETAGALGYTERSVRWYLHQVYHKRGLSGQVDLVRLVLSLTAFA